MRIQVERSRRLSTMSYATVLVLALLLNVANAQFRGRVTDLQIAGGGDRNGYIEATVLYANGTRATGPVCGSVNLVTATFACYSRTLLSSSTQGTVASIGGISLPTAPPVASSLSCTSYSSNNGQVTYGCTFSSRADCTPSNSAAVECNLTVGEVVGIVIGCLIFLALIIAIPIIICCCCFCGIAYFAARKSKSHA